MKFKREFAPLEIVVETLEEQTTLHNVLLYFLQYAIPPGRLRVESVTYTQDVEMYKNVEDMYTKLNSRILYD